MRNIQASLIKCTAKLFILGNIKYTYSLHVVFSFFIMPLIDSSYIKVGPINAKIYVLIFLYLKINFRPVGTAP